ncbi:VOC family protein [Streptomyces sp. NPDC050355]|uniref:VOC family protein n=1 Tax=Streptomyces sp. NPDC050355 TaxID=3365609 RepID=UPI003788515C
MSLDVHDDVERLEKLGATVAVPATAVGEVAVFARLRDPLGNAFALFSRTSSRELEERAAATEEHIEQAACAPAPGGFAWFEIGTTDPQASQDFYRQAFGWRFEKDDSAGGKPYYNVFTGNEWPSGGMYDHSCGPGGADYTMPSFLVTDVPATIAAATEGGATVEHGPDSNPDGLVFARLTDPNGNRFGLFSMAAPS